MENRCRTCGQLAHEIIQTDAHPAGIEGDERSTAIEDIAKLALLHASMFATETACKAFVKMAREKKVTR